MMDDSVFARFANGIAASTCLLWETAINLLVFRVAQTPH